MKPAGRSRDASPETDVGAMSRWERVHQALQSALDLEPDARSDYLAAVAQEDPGLRHEVESLLDASEGAGPFDELIDRYVSHAATPATPERIGNYRVIRLLARGGMGSVFLAERADGAFDQRVALKLLPAGTRADLYSRFLAERRILARLRHPNIARLMDGGSTNDGLPWLVMEYVEGEPVTEYCDRLRLPVEDRLRIFVDICAAVSWAHSNLVVHRDIKPANVLVVPAGAGGDSPRVKLLDFGIAKLLDDDAAGDDAAVTRADFRMLTPDYAAPEQVRGELVTTATDVYQLGVLLYELLAGRRPHRFSSRTLEEIEREICRNEPVRPSIAFRTSSSSDTDGLDAQAIGHSRTTTPKRLEHALAGDLDSIILHALAREPGRRYPSVDAFAEDIQRFIDEKPVLARPDTLGYRTARFVRRNRGAVLAGGTVLTLLITFGIAVIQQNGRIQAQRDRAEQSAGFVIQLFRDLEPAQARGSTVEAREILDRAAVRVTIEMQEQPLLQARLFDVLGRVYQLRGFYADAEPLLREALALRIAGLGPDHVDVASSRYALADLLAETDRRDEAEPLLAAATETYRRRLGSSDPRTALAEIDQALARRAKGDGEGADSILAAVIDVLRDHPERRDDLATALLYRGKVHIERGDTAGAGPMVREALRIRRSVFGETHPTIANALDGVGELLQVGGDYAAAEQAYRDALAVRQRLFPADHADLGVSYENLGIILRLQHRMDEAAIMLGSALDILEPAFGNDHDLVRVAIANLDSIRLSRILATGPER